MTRSLLLLAALAAGSVSAQQMSFQMPWQRQMAETQMIHQFLSTEVGKNFTEQQVRQAMLQPLATTGEATSEGVFIINETFDKWTAGSNDAPDTQMVPADDQAAVDALCDEPGWTAFICYQAGGSVYTGFDEVGDDGPGYLMTRDFDMTQNQGVFHIKLRAKNVNENATTQNLQYFVLDNNPEHPGMILANGLALTYGEWVDLEVVGHSNSQYTTVMLFGWNGKVLIDDIQVIDSQYALPTPGNITVEALSATQVKVGCDPVEGATSYTFSAYSRAEGSDTYTADSTEPSAVLTGVFDPEEDVIVTVVAHCAEGDSYPGVGYAPIRYTGVIDAPVALEATNVTNQGFTANWEPSVWAYTYGLDLNRTHTVGDVPEAFYYMQEDFSEVPFSTDDTRSTVMTQDGKVVSLNDYINAKGWNVYLASCATGMLALTNIYEAYGYPGLMVSDAKDFSLGGGKVHVSGIGMAMADDIVLKVGFAEAHASMFGTTYTFLEGAQEFELSTMGSMFDVEVEGGTADSRLLIQMVDASPAGDMAVFVNLNIMTEVQPGEQYSAPYAYINVPGTETSYDVEVDFPAGDVYTYNVVAKYGSRTSEASEVITVQAPTPDGIDRTEVEARFAEFFTLDGRRVQARDLDQLQDGTYIMRSAQGAAKVMK